MSILVTSKESEIIVSSEEQKVIVTSSNPVVEVSAGGLPGAKGSDGEGVPAGGSAGQVLAKVDGDDYNTEWVDDANTVTWIDLAGDVEYTGVETTILSGTVSECDYKGNTIFRFESTAENANGYLIEDSFYSNFDGTNLTNKIVQRGQ